MDLGSYYIKNSLKTSLYYLAIFFYLLSLINICISSPWQGVQERGYELLFLGWIQTIFGLFTFNILAVLPWLGNIFIFSTVTFIYFDFNKRLCLLSAFFSVICILSFVYSPNVMMGADLAMITVKINIGVYMWLTSAVLLVSSAFFVQDMPNKSLK